MLWGDGSSAAEAAAEAAQAAVRSTANFFIALLVLVVCGALWAVDVLLMLVLIPLGII